jgi:hypothetical protein
MAVVMEPAVLERLSAPGTKARRLQELLLAQYQRHVDEDTLPTSGRFLFYELEQQGAISKVRTGVRRADQDLIDQLTSLRERGLIPWADIYDDTREVASWEKAPTVLDYVLNNVRYARIDPWLRGVQPIILCEARTVGGVLKRRIAPEYLVEVAPTNGQCQGFLVTQVVPHLTHRSRVGYVGDLDLSGNYIEANTRRVLEREVGFELAWERIAITEAQTRYLRQTYGMEPIEKADERFRPPRKHLAYEAEALGQAALEAIIREWLEALLPVSLDRLRAREAREQAQVRRHLARLRKGGAS